MFGLHWHYLRRTFFLKPFDIVWRICRLVADDPDHQALTRSAQILIVDFHKVNLGLIISFHSLSERDVVLNCIWKSFTSRRTSTRIDPEAILHFVYLLEAVWIWRYERLAHLKLIRIFFESCLIYLIERKQAVVSQLVRWDELAFEGRVDAGEICQTLELSTGEL